MIRRRLTIYLVSLAISLAVFLWIKAKYFQPEFPVARHHLKPVPIKSGTGGSNLVMVDRKPNGRLLYVLRFRRAIPTGNGRYHLVQPRMEFFSSGQNAMLVTSDKGDVSVDQLGGPLSNHIYPRKGRLYGHVVVTVGPEKSFVSGQKQRQPGQFQMLLSRPIHFNYQEGLITSRGAVRVHGDRVEFLGRRLTCELNVATKKLDYLQIEHGDYLIIKHVGAAAAGGSGASGAAPPNSAHPTTAPARPSQSVATRPATTHPSPATQPIGATSRPAAASQNLYRLVFTQKVHVKIGRQTLWAHRLRLYFSSARGASAGSGAPAAAAKKPPAGKIAGPAGTTAPPPHAKTASNAGRTLIVHWKGPLTLRPVQRQTIHLINKKDVVLQAFGRSGSPVILHDGPSRSGVASVVMYHLGDRTLRMTASGLAPIKFVDATVGTITCRSLLYQANAGRLFLGGPGQWIYHRGTKHQQTRRGSWRGSWQKQMRLVLARLPDGKSAIKSLRILTDATLYNHTFHLKADAMHATFAAAIKGNPSLKQFVSRGHVELRSTNIAAATANQQSDTLDCDLLRLTTSVNAATHQRQPALLYAAGKISLHFSQATAGTAATGRKAQRYHLRSGYLQAHLENLAGAGTLGRPHPSSGPFGSTGGSFSIGRFHAWKHVRLVISGGTYPIRASCDDLRGNRNTKLLALISHATSRSMAKIREHHNWIAGRNIELNGKSDDLKIPGPGSLYLSSRSHGHQPSDMLLTWQGRMYFRKKIGEATFFSHALAKLVGQPLRQSRLSAPVLRVKVSNRHTGKMRLSEIYAFCLKPHQHVEAQDVSYDSARLVDTRVYLHCRRLRYDAIKQHLLVAGKGKLLLENYRSAPARKHQSQPNNRGQSAFQWSRSLDYRAGTGHLSLSGAVRLVYRPMKAFVLPRSIAGSNRGPNAGLILLKAAKLIAHLLRPHRQVASGVALGMGGPARLKSVHAYKAALELAGTRLTADVLAFEALPQIATAYSAQGRDAHITTYNGKLNAAAREIIWHLGKSQSAITLVQPRASGTVP